MRIDHVELDLLDVPLRVPLTTAAGTWQRRRIGLVRVRTDAGIEGIGEVASDLRKGIERIDASPLRTLLLGLDITDETARQERFAAVDGRPAFGRPLRSAVESALVDLLARAARSSVAVWLADDAPRDVVRLNAFIGIDDAGTVAHLARRHAAAGFSCLKLKASDEPIEAIVDRLAAVRAAVGRTMRLRLDLNGSLTPDRAQRLLDAVARFDLEYVEQPLAAGDGVEATARLRRNSPVAIAADESLDGFESAQRLLDAEAVDVFVLKPARVGGLLSAARIARVAAASGVSIVISTLFESGIGIAGAVHLAASLSGDEAHGLATADLLADDLLAMPLNVTGGTMAVPAGPGLGVELNQAAVEALRWR